MTEQRLTPLDSAQQVDQVKAETARMKFENHFGTLGSETSISADNQTIDADLASEYASNHE